MKPRLSRYERTIIKIPMQFLRLGGQKMITTPVRADHWALPPVQDVAVLNGWPAPTTGNRFWRSGRLAL
jgi:hypothetical protein